jgi:hypothetical protein
MDVKDVKKTVLMATIPERREAFEKIVAALAPQVDEIYVSYNRYTEIPDVEGVTKAQLDTENADGCNSVFRMLDDVTGFVFMCDDDILYPDDYVEKMLSYYKPQSFICAYTQEISNIDKLQYLDNTSSRSFTHSNQSFYQSDVIGTGCCSFCADEIKPGGFKYRNHRDLQLSIFALENGFNIYRIPAKMYWLTRLETKNSPKIRNEWRVDAVEVKRKELLYSIQLAPLLRKRRKIQRELSVKNGT